MNWILTVNLAGQWWVNWANLPNRCTLTRSWKLWYLEMERLYLIVFRSKWSCILTWFSSVDAKYSICSVKKGTWARCIVVKGLWLCLWELWHSVINTAQYCVVLIMECHNFHKHSQSPLTSCIAEWVYC